MPTASRTAATYSSSIAIPLSVTSVATKGCSICVCSHGVRFEGSVTVPGVTETISMPKSILSQVMPMHFFPFLHSLGIDLGIL